jgi:hypothetical protein
LVSLQQATIDNLDTLGISLQNKKILELEFERLKQASIKNPEVLEKFQEVLRRHRIYEQKFFKNQLNGPDLRRLLQNLNTVFDELRVELVESDLMTSIEYDEFEAKHKPPLVSLNIINELSRKSDRQLTDQEVATFDSECNNYGNLWRELYQRPLTPKAHIIETHLSWQGNIELLVTSAQRDPKPPIHNMIKQLCSVAVLQNQRNEHWQS